MPLTCLETMATISAQRSLGRWAIATALLLASSCQPPPATEAPATPSPTPTAALSSTPTPSPSPTASPSPAALLAQARDLGTGAAALAQSANTPADWQFVATQLQRALNLLAAIPADSAESEAAATLKADYEGKLTAATARSEGAPRPAPPAASPAPEDLRVRVGTDAGATPAAGTGEPGSGSTPGFPDSEECRGPDPNSAGEAGNSTLGYTLVRIYVPTSEDATLAQDGSAYLVGCIINRGDQPLSRVGVRYTYKRGGTPGTGFGELVFPTTPVPAGQMAAFRSAFTLDSQIQDIELVSFESVYGEIAVGNRLYR